MIEFISLVIGFIIALLCSGIFGGNIITFIVIWGVGMAASAILLVILGVVIGVLFKCLIIILIIVLLIVLIKRLSSGGK
ncbi:hypothetical protein [Heyndrickxia ginsengihumi]|uniref:Uncharacterized protein n=1 Tax=Heyndrickxia ginsengihumi TaxID=363870 RepID=A0A0A6VDD6_9BACI|nr:hypothetical protein [Heyndrickxia ginsengihumi]KHD84544.1 hypothetical protein NG54_14845 [Heyndrickxia ginsengihumi]MBE6185061.1 hypothetical protein [Bacillus sp. (in: firmicutes)]MCM3022303.1 hypothetical protein [Heyndrickxia ginsengihumi]NEY18537.1 hypothetical protein [Heyndrickxia ginsengihumi]